MLGYTIPDEVFYRGAAPQNSDASCDIGHSERAPSLRDWNRSALLPLRMPGLGAKIDIKG